MLAQLRCFPLNPFRGKPDQQKSMISLKEFGRTNSMNFQGLVLRWRGHPRDTRSAQGTAS